MLVRLQQTAESCTVRVFASFRDSLHDSGFRGLEAKGFRVRV